MKFTGFVVRINQHGRISLPSEVRRQLYLKPTDKVTFNIKNNSIVLRKRQLHCLITDSTENVKEVLPGVPLSREGIEILMQELKNYNF